MRLRPLHVRHIALHLLLWRLQSWRTSEVLLCLRHVSWSTSEIWLLALPIEVWSLHSWRASEIWLLALPIELPVGVWRLLHVSCCTIIPSILLYGPVVIWVCHSCIATVVVIGSIISVPHNGCSAALMEVIRSMTITSMEVPVVEAKTIASQISAPIVVKPWIPTWVVVWIVP
jgi:hypothetical protein